MNNKARMNNLVAHQIPLTGKHLIEASAGTGKTYNITRLYLRLLLEKQLPVEQILVMTFTKDATQELKGRIDSSIREALANWQTLVENDTFFQHLAKHVDEQQATFLLKKALVYLDEAAIFTIHGFCQRVLAEYAFSAGLPFELALETDLTDITEQACQDFYRTLANRQVERFMLLAEHWPTPQQFLSSFNKAISHQAQLSCLAFSDILVSISASIKQALCSLNDNQTLIFDTLINNQKSDKKQARQQEWQTLLDVLQNYDDFIAEHLALNNAIVELDSFVEQFLDIREYPDRFLSRYAL